MDIGDERIDNRSITYIQVLRSLRYLKYYITQCHCSVNYLQYTMDWQVYEKKNCAWISPISWKWIKYVREWSGQNIRFSGSWDRTTHGWSHLTAAQIARFMWLTWGPPGSWRPQVGPTLATWILLSGRVCHRVGHYRDYSPDARF